LDAYTPLGASPRETEQTGAKSVPLGVPYTALKKKNMTRNQLLFGTASLMLYGCLLDAHALIIHQRRTCTVGRCLP
jgi:hypothetical protein